MDNKQLQKAKQFHELHQRDDLFILPNAWDVISAKMFEECGFKAIGTTSAGIAVSKGYPDGEAIPLDEMIKAIQNIANAVQVPVSADIESGYGETVDEVLHTVKKVVQAGAIGINLEDGTGDTNEHLFDLTLQVEKIKAIKQLREDTNMPLFINARTDTYWLNIKDPAQRLQETIKRAQAFEQAGADCIFVPGLEDIDIIQRLRREITCPINLLVSPNLPSTQKLSNIGIERISCGSAPFRSTVTLIKQMSEEMLQKGSFKRSTDGVLSYKEVTKLV